MNKFLSFVAITSLFLSGCGQMPQGAAVNQTQQQIAANAGELAITGLTFTFPQGWSLEKIEEQSNKVGTWQVANIKVPDPKYRVTIPMEAFKTDYSVKTDDHLLRETSSGAKIYGNVCAPGLACYYLVYMGTTYDVRFGEPDSDQPSPENPDGVWFPDTTVTAKDILDFMSTVK